MKKTLYLMRHGQTLFNLLGKKQGSCDSPLTERGIEQAEIARDFFKEHGISFGAAYSSTQERACDTLEIVTDFKMPYQRVKGLKEWHFGVFEGENERLNPPLPYDDFFVKYGGESQEEVVKRMGETITNLMEETDAETVLMVSHGGSCACFTRFFVEKKNVEWQRMTNCCIFRFTYEDGEFCFEEILNHGL